MLSARMPPSGGGFVRRLGILGIFGIFRLLIPVQPGVILQGLLFILNQFPADPDDQESRCQLGDGPKPVVEGGKQDGGKAQPVGESPES